MLRVSLRVGLYLLITIIVALAAAQPALAIPAFTRQYNTSCTTCHIDFPKLNDFGKAFKDAGFKFPKDDDSFLKIPPVLLGAPAQVELWPRTVWPGRIPGLPPIGLRMNNYFQVVGKNRGNFAFASTSAPPTIPGFVPRTDFETGLFSIFTAGNFGSDIAFWADNDISVAGDNSNAHLGDGYLRFVNLSRFLHLPTDSLHLRAGQFELDLPFTQARSYDISPYDIYGQNNIGTGNQFISNGFNLAAAGKGVEISGGHTYRGYHYSLAIVDQNTSIPSVVQSANVNGFVPSATGAAGGSGLGFASDANYKDLYGRLAYRFNLERDPESRNAIQAAGATGPRDHTYLSLGTFWFYGRSVQRLVGVSTTGMCAPPSPPGDTSGCVLLTAREPFYRAGADFSFNYRTFNLYGLYMYGRDQNLLPVSIGSNVLPSSFMRGRPAEFGGGFLQADYLPLPWIMLIMRYDGVNSRADFLNGASGIFTVHQTRSRFTPGVQFLIHANIKASFEYQVRPEQQIPVATDPLTGASLTVGNYRTNTATVALEFVY